MADLSNPDEGLDATCALCGSHEDIANGTGLCAGCALETAEAAIDRWTDEQIAHLLADVTGFINN